MQTTTYRPIQNGFPCPHFLRIHVTGVKLRYTYCTKVYQPSLSGDGCISTSTLRILIYICHLYLFCYFLYKAVFTQNVSSTEWPFMCWCAIKKLLTHASAIIINRHTTGTYLLPCQTSTGCTAWRPPHVTSQDLSGPSRHYLLPGTQQISAAQPTHGIPVNSTLSTSIPGQSYVFVCIITVVIIIIITTGISFLSELGHRVTGVSGDLRETIHLFQWVSLAVHHYSLAAFKGPLWSPLN